MADSYSSSKSKKGEKYTMDSHDDEYLAPPPSYGEALVSNSFSVPTSSKASSSSSIFKRMFSGSKKSKTPEPAFVNNPPKIVTSDTFASNPSKSYDPSFATKPAFKKSESKEDPLETLAKYDIVFIVDDSGSMSGSLWLEAQDALANLVDKVAKYDNDGVDVYFLNSKFKWKGVNTHSDVRTIFRKVRPGGPTPIAARLQSVVGKYTDEMLKVFQKHRYDLADYMKPVIYVVITDGCASDDPASVIQQIAGELDRYNVPMSQMGIQFVQIGNDKRATEFLRELDDDLSRKKGVRDMVDTTPYEGRKLTDEDLIKVMLGGINRRVDRRGGGVMMG